MLIYFKPLRYSQFWILTTICTWDPKCETHPCYFGNAQLVQNLYFISNNDNCPPILVLSVTKSSFINSNASSSLMTSREPPERYPSMLIKLRVPYSCTLLVFAYVYLSIQIYSFPNHHHLPTTPFYSGREFIHTRLFLKSGGPPPGQHSLFQTIF